MPDESDERRQDDVEAYILGDVEMFFQSFESGAMAEQWEKDQIEFQDRLRRFGEMVQPEGDASLD